MIEAAERIIEDSFDAAVAKHLLSTFVSVERHFALGDWKECVVWGGHFVEATRRALDLKLFDTYVGFGEEDHLPPFGKDVMMKYIKADGHPSYTKIIPYTLKSIYNIRNNRGAGHLSKVSPGEMDATHVLYSAKWVLAEVIRLNSDLKASGTTEMVKAIMEREISLIWKEDGFRKVLETSLDANEQVLILLYDESPLPAKTLFESVEQANLYNFRNRVLRPLHEERLIFFNEDSGECRISPTGVIEAERLIVNHD